MKTSDLLRRIPSVTDLLANPTLKVLVDKVSHNVVVDSARTFLDEIRTEYQEENGEGEMPSISEIAERIAKRILVGERPALRPVINATGVILHTGLGRAPLSQEALEAIVEVAQEYVNVELDLKSGERSNRAEIVEGLLKQLTGAEAAFVVNNNAGATVLALAALATGKEVIVSRGELVEIGGSYRLPDVMSASGAILREVGTTNKTRASDYEQAIGESTAALMRVHTSNFRVVGFTESPSLADLVKIGKQANLPVIDDIGSGALVDFEKYGCKSEPDVRSSVADGADLVLFSGDKLLGGPQCGILLGRKALIEKIASHPLARALRVGKLTLAALSATLRLYRDENKAAQSIPILQLLSAPMENLANRAERMQPQIEQAPAVEAAEVILEEAFLGGGSLPEEAVPTHCISITPAGKTVEQFSQALRMGDKPVVARIQKDRVLIDLRSVFARQDINLVEAINAIV